jgi:hypothetical protein
VNDARLAGVRDELSLGFRPSPEMTALHICR